jgi:hypothetical protein
MYWHKLTPEQANKLYLFPKELAYNPDNSFYGSSSYPFSNQFNIDGPWPTFGFVTDSNNPGMVTLHAYDILPEYLEFDAFDLLSEGRSGIKLNKDALESLLSVLTLQGSFLRENPHVQDAHFLKLQADEPLALKFRPEWFKNMRLDFYLQLSHETITEHTNSKTPTVIVIGRNKVSPNNYIDFTVAKFPDNASEESNFIPWDKALAQITLDKAGIDALKALLMPYSAELNR